MLWLITGILSVLGLYGLWYIHWGEIKKIRTRFFQQVTNVLTQSTMDLSIPELEELLKMVDEVSIRVYVNEYVKFVCKREDYPDIFKCHVDPYKDALVYAYADYLRQTATHALKIKRGEVS